MTDIPASHAGSTFRSPDAPIARRHYLNHASGFKSWAFTLDHKRIGIMYLVAVSFFFLLAGILAMLIRTEHLVGAQTTIEANGALRSSDQGTIMQQGVYNKVFSMHGIIMVFLFIIPAIPAALGNFVLPIMLGAKDVAFPKLNLLSFHIYCFGTLFALVAIFWTGGVDTGWTFYTPYSTNPDYAKTAVFWITSGAFILGFSSILTGMNFIVTIHKLRPPGMTWFRLPLFLWALYATSLIQILATPVLAITLLLLIAERTLQMGIFDPALGGDPLLYQHFFWFYSHPAVYIMILPAFGITSELISAFSHKHIFGYKFIAFSSLAIALIGFLVWGHHMFTSGQQGVTGAIFSFLTFLVAIPSAVKVFNWLATMYKGSIDLRTPMLYTLSFVFIFGIGGLTGLFLGTMSVDVHLHDTYFVVAHFHYVMAGTVFTFVAGVFYWWPKMFGKMYDEAWGQLSAVLTFVGFNLTFFPQFMLGSHGMPRRYWSYLPEFQSYHVWSTIGAYVTAVGLVTALGVLLHSLARGRPAPRNPWGAATLEWQTSSPPPHDNFAITPRATDPYDFDNMVYIPQTGEFVKAEPASVPAGSKA